MKTVILAGGLGTRIQEESIKVPKPMIQIGNYPILWHIMKLYSHWGLNDFIVCLGYKSYVIKEYFAKFHSNHSDLRYDFAKNTVEIISTKMEPWRVTLVDTGEATMTGGRLKMIRDHLDGNAFCMTYGDGLTDLNIQQLIQHHCYRKAVCTMTVVQKCERFGTVELQQGSDQIASFKEKPANGDSWINGGFFVLEHECLEYVTDAMTVWESDPMNRLANDGKLSAFRHNGFWQCMDTMKEKSLLEQLWESGEAPWALWK
jgi:glucose-1-phosphate cytidylyltransferase